MTLLRRVRRFALGDPLAEWYAGAAQGAFVAIAVVIAVLLAVIVVAYAPDQEQLASPDQSPPPAWSTDPLSSRRS